VHLVLRQCWNTVLIAADTERQIRVALSRAIAILVETVAITPMQVDAMLAVEPREIAGVLDDYDIPQIKDFEPSSSTNVADQQPLDLADVGDKSEFGVQEVETTEDPASTEEIAAGEPDKPSPTSEQGSRRRRWATILNSASKRRSPPRRRKLRQLKRTGYHLYPIYRAGGHVNYFRQTIRR